MAEAWEQYENRYRERPETYAAYVDVWNRVPRVRQEFTGWAVFSQTANAEPKQRRDNPDRVKVAEEIMIAGGYQIGQPTVRGGRRWFKRDS